MKTYLPQAAGRSNGAARKSWALALLAAGALAMGVSAMGQTSPAGTPPPAHSHAGMAAGHSADAMSQHLYSTLNVTDAQKAKLDPLMKQTATDFGDFHAQLESGHGEIMSLLTANTVDRTALERLRVAKMHEMDLASKRLVDHLADVADALTPAQRKQARDAMAQHHAEH
ncbi:Spy/CpxP family protein refolding chaperone [Dyella humicola]|uniref:Spy/CpxP family protein refolding chaperone n=1 Tax=Dyella humicola TaxID=2992126 RepID=UPI002250000B|nr:periplasmic heavy metal sensor [Dyella humicola]